MINNYEMKTAIVSAEDKKEFMIEVSKATTDLLNKGFEVTTQYQTVGSGIGNWKVIHYMYIEGRKNHPPKDNTITV